jgi:hypothetical protein
MKCYRCGAPIVWFPLDLFGFCTGCMVGIGYTVLVWPWIVRHWLIVQAAKVDKVKIGLTYK